MILTLLCVYFIIGAAVLEDTKKVVKKILMISYLELALFMWKENMDTDEARQLIDNYPKIAAFFIEAGTIVTWPMVLPRLIKTKRAYEKFLRRRREGDVDLFKDFVFREYYEAMKRGEEDAGNEKM